MTAPMRLAIVHDASGRTGGAERVLEELRAAFPNAEVFSVDPPLGNTGEHSSFVRRIPRWLRRRKVHFPLLPIAAETFDLSSFDVVISSCSTVAKGVVTRPGTLHICYTHAPSRMVWDATNQAVLRFPSRTLRRGLFRLVLHHLRLWDASAARRVDLFLANSETTRVRIRKYYGRDAVVVPPPLALHVQAPARAPEIREHFLFVGRLTSSKRCRLAVETFLKLELPLLVVGEGPEQISLMRRARVPIRLLGAVPDETLSHLYATARAVIFPSDDDFGLVPIEALAHETPVIALRRGGATETIEEGVTGEFFDEPEEEFLADAVRRFMAHERSYNRARMRVQAERYDAAQFRKTMQDLVTHAWEMWRENHAFSVEPSSLRARPHAV